jgi:hypothetical protein
MLKERLVEGETVLGVGRIHDGIYWPAAAVFLLGVIFALFIASRLGLLLFFVALLMALHAFARQQILLFVLTNKRVLARAGLLKIDVADIHLDKIESIEVEQMLPGYLLGYANLVVTGMGNRYISIPYVANAAAIRKAFIETTLGE